MISEGEKAIVYVIQPRQLIIERIEKRKTLMLVELFSH